MAFSASAVRSDSHRTDATYATPPEPDAIPGVSRREGEVIIGTLAGLRGVKNLPRLVRAVAPISNARLVIIGEGPERGAILAEAARCKMAERIKSDSAQKTLL